MVDEPEFPRYAPLPVGGLHVEYCEKRKQEILSRQNRAEAVLVV